MAKDGMALALDSAQLISSMFALIPVPVAITDDRGRVVLSNSSFSEIFPGSSNIASLPQQEVQVFNRGTFRVQTLPLNDEGYKIVYASDISDEVQLRKQITHLEKMAAIGRVVTGVAHELSNPLTEIAGYAPLAEKCNLPAEARQIVGAVFTKAERAAYLVQNLLVLAGITAPKRVTFDLNAIVRNIVELRGCRKAGEYDVALDLDANLPKAVGDPSQIEQVFLTLLINAEDSVSGPQRRPGSIHVRTCVRTGRIQLHVSDNGVGRDAARLFEPNENGVGLNICAEIVKDHGGELFAWSSYGSGETWTLELPAVMQDASEAGAGAGKCLRGKNVMVVDDEVHITEFVYDALSRHGANVQIANSGSEAYELLRNKHYDLILCDHHMPGLSGQSLYRLLESSNPDMPRRFLFVTGDVLAAEARQFFSQTGVHFLKKPFRTQELLEAISQTFGDPRRDS